MKKFIPTLVFALVTTAAVAGGYHLMKKFFRDRQSAMLTSRPAPPRRQMAAQTEGGTSNDFTGAPVTKTASGVAGPTVDASGAGQAAIQRQLKTLEDINNINEMNRRLMEQQRQMQKQR